MNMESLHERVFQRGIGSQRLAIRGLDQLLVRARTSHPQSQEATAHSFASWVWGLNHRPFAYGAFKTRSALQRARERLSNVIDRNAAGQVGEFNLVSCDAGNAIDKIYTSSVLTLSGKPLRMKPDAVWRHSRTNLLVIAEMKLPAEGALIPDCGWPNLATQLWAYSWIDEWKDVEHMVLVGALYERGLREEVDILDLCPRTIKADPDLNAACARLFRAWGGDIHPNVVKSTKLQKLLG